MRVHKNPTDNRIRVVNGFQLVEQVPRTTACGRIIGRGWYDIPKDRTTKADDEVDCKSCLRSM